MASVHTFILSNTETSVTSMNFEGSFTPPSNIAGKLCYVNAIYFVFANGSAPTPTINQADCFLVTCDWAQPWSVTTNNSGSKLGAPLAFMTNNRSYTSGPVLIRMPNNPHVVRFNVSRPDGNALTGSSGTSILTLHLSIIVANGKQPPFVS
jgi:hypothetical protein